MAVEIQWVRTEAQAVHVRTLAWEFIDWLRERYPELEAGIQEYLTNQSFDQQLAELLDHFTPPAGECLLAVEGGTPLGILMLKPHSDGVCEMNRMFVRPEARGKRVARGLCTTLIERARELGYDAMVLGALNRHREAISLYKSLGFVADERPAEVESAADLEVKMRLDL